MSIITEEMRYRQKVCGYALKKGVTKAARRYKTNRQFIYRQLKKYDGKVRSLALKSRKPGGHPNQHTKDELGYEVKRTRPYSPWQNGKVERSHREDGKILYNRKIFYSKTDLINQVAKHERRYNNTAKLCLNFKSPNEVV